MKQWRWLLAVVITCSSATLACASVTAFNPLARATATPVSAAAVPSQAVSSASSQTEVLDAIDQAVREQYVRADFDGVDWAGAVQQARAQITAGVSDADFAQLLRTLVAKLPEGRAIYQTRAERIALETTSTTTFQGIGVFYGFRTTPQPRVVILSVVKGSPAEKAGLQAHDAILGIDQQPVRADERATIADRIRGKAGTSVTVTVQTPGQTARDVLIQRGVISATDDLRGGPLGSTGVLYYRVPVVAGQDLAQLLAQDLGTRAQNGSLKGVILDLRLSGSTAGWPLVEMLTLFSDGTLGESYSRTTKEALTVKGVDVGGSQKLPLMLLVGPDTREDGQLFAGILQGAKRATLVGLPTLGQTEGFTQVDLPDGSRLTLATSSFRLPDGTDFSRSGLKPDVAVDRDWDSFGVKDDDPVIQAALGKLQP